MKERATVQTSLLGIAKKARTDRQYRFRNLYRELNEEMLRDSWRLLRKDAALGVDQISAAEYEANLDENIQQLVERLKRKSYRAKLVRRHYIPKGEGKMRPLGIPATEDKLSWKSVCESSGWNWRRIRRGLSRLVATVAERPVLTFWGSNFAGAP